MSKIVIKFETEDGKPLSSTEVRCEPGKEGGIIRATWCFLDDYCEEEE